MAWMHMIKNIEHLVMITKYWNPVYLIFWTHTNYWNPVYLFFQFWICKNFYIFWDQSIFQFISAAKLKPYLPHNSACSFCVINYFYACFFFSALFSLFQINKILVQIIKKWTLIFRGFGLQIKLLIWDINKNWFIVVLSIISIVLKGNPNCKHLPEDTFFKKWN